MIGKAIYNLLNNDTDVAALVGDRIYPSLAIEEVIYPYITYTMNSNEFNDTKDGKSTLDVLEYDIEIWTQKLNEANDIALKVRNVLDRYTGTVEGIDIQSVRFLAENVDYTDDNRMYLKMQSYSFRYLTVYSTLTKATNLIATPFSTTQIDLSWTDNSNGEVGFEVWRSNDLVGWNLITTTASNSTTYNDTGLSISTQYYYRIRPTDGLNGGEWSNIVGGRTDNGTVTPNGIAYDRPQLTGQLTSYRVGDDAWHLANGTYSYVQPIYPINYARLDYTSATPFIKLTDNNAFGNKNRFTDENGLQVYGSDYVIDHLTGLGWYILINAVNVNWNDAIDNCHTSTLLGYNDWRLPNVSEWDSLLNNDVYVGTALNYTPFNLTNTIRKVSSTTGAKANTKCMIWQTLTFGMISKTYVNKKYYQVRNHYN